MASPIHAIPLRLLFQGASQGSDVLQRRQGWGLSSETLFLSTKLRRRTARAALTRWQPRAAHEDEISVFESQS